MKTKANKQDLLNIGSKTRIHGIKVILNCTHCGRKWSIWFAEQDELDNNLPEYWHLCASCGGIYTDKEGNNE